MEFQKKPTISLSRCVLGTAGLGGVWGKVNPAESVKSILKALEFGINAIDTAPAYGDAERFVGAALKQWKWPLPEISTKAGRLKSYAADQCFYDYSPAGLQKSVENSLQTLGLPAVDILFLHEPSALQENDAQRIIENLLDIKRKGYAKRLGVGGNSPGWFKKYITPAVFDVVMEYNRLDACCLEALDTVLPECEAKEIEFYLASPLHMGLLGNRFESFTENPPAWLRKKDIDCARRVKKIAHNHGISLASLSHRFLLTVPYHYKIVIGASDARQLQHTLSDFEDGPLPANIYAEIINSIN